MARHRASLLLETTVENAPTFILFSNVFFVVFFVVFVVVVVFVAFCVLTTIDDCPIVL